MYIPMYGTYAVCVHDEDECVEHVRSAEMSCGGNNETRERLVIPADSRQRTRLRWWVKLQSR